MRMMAKFPEQGEAWVTVSASPTHPHVYILQLHRAPDNRFNRGFCDALISAYHYVNTLNSADQPIALVTTGTGKFYSNGLDFSEFNQGFIPFIQEAYYPMLKAWMSAPFVTVAALNGHTFAGGMMFAMAHDYRVMRSDRGFICMNEVDLKIPMAPGMVGMVRAKISDPVILRNCLLQGKRFSAVEALSAGIIDEVVDVRGREDDVVEKAVALAEKWRSKGSDAYAALKQELWRDAMHYLNSTDMGFVDLVFAENKPHL